MQVLVVGEAGHEERVAGGREAVHRGQEPQQAGTDDQTHEPQRNQLQYGQKRGVTCRQLGRGKGVCVFVRVGGCR